MELEPAILKLSDVQDRMVSRFLAETLDESIALSPSRLRRLESDLETLQPHDLVQYCDFSLRLSGQPFHRPVYIGYSVLPHSPTGVCH